MLQKFTSLLVAGFVCLGLSGPAFAEKRVALVLGNAGYQHTAALDNPLNDATDMAEKLRELNFEVILATDLTKRDMERQIRAFTESLTGADVGLFFYAGHGLATRVDGKNYLVPIDAELKRESDLDFEAIDLDLVLKQMERSSRVSLVFLDACRDNPLAQRFARASRTVQVSRGLNSVEKAVGMLIGLATSPGNVALDGEGRNSPYTTALLRHIGADGKSINDLMIEVRNEVLAATDGRQIPWETSSLTGQFYFKPKSGEGGASSAEIAGLRDQIDRLQSSQSALLEAQQKQLKLLQEKLEAASATDDASPASETVSEAAAEATEDAAGTAAEAVSDTPEAPAAETVAVTPEEPAASEPSSSSREIVAEAAGESPAPAEAEATAETEGAPAETAKAATESESAKPDTEEKVAEAEAEPEPTKLAAVDAKTAEPEQAAAETPELPVEIDEFALSRDIQTALKELQCYRGKVDGAWGRGTRGGVERFNKVAKLDLNPDRADAATLEALKAWEGAKCVPEEVVHRKEPAKKKEPATKAPAQAKKSSPPRRERVEREPSGGSSVGIIVGPSIGLRGRRGGFDIETDAVHRNLRPNLP